MKFRTLLLLLGLVPAWADAAGNQGTLKIGVLAFGTVNWELEAIRQQGLDKKHGLNLEVQKLASPDAGKIGLQGQTLDMIATDWIWVANQDQGGADYRFIPFSTQAGALMGKADSQIKSVGDLKGKKIGVAGGPLDKNWVLLKAYAKQSAGLDLDKDATPVFAAPPLLNQQFVEGKLDVLLNFWHYAAKLEAQGYRRVLDGREILKGLGINQATPNLGYVFHQDFGKTQGPALAAFLKATADARKALCSKDEAWAKIVPLLQEPDSKQQAALRKEYCTGFVQHWGEADKQELGKIYGILHAVGGEALTGKSATLPQEIFWPFKLEP